MKAIPVSIREKFVRYVGSQIKTEAAYRFQSLTNQCTLQLAGLQRNDDRVVNVSIDPSMIQAVSELLGTTKVEKYTNKIHRQLKNELQEAIVATAAAEMVKPEPDMDLMQSIQAVNDFFTQWEADIDEWEETQISEGGLFFGMLS
jgi:hypothetical protein